MMYRLAISVLVVSLFTVHHGCSSRVSADLAIFHADVFDAQTGKVIPDQTILVKDGKILGIEAGVSGVKTTHTIDAKRKLVTPGFIDTHIHPTDVFGDGDQAPEYLPADSLDAYRKRWSDQYLPYGVTTVLSMGQPEKWLPDMVKWQKNPSPSHIDLYVAGGALISAESRKLYVGHTAVNSPAEARQKILEYHAMGLQHVKLYWRLRQPEFEAAMHTADSLGMKVYGHIDQNIMFMDTTLQLGLRHYEHILTMDLNVLHLQKDGAELGQIIQQHYGPSARNFPLVRLEMLRFVLEHHPGALDTLIRKLGSQGATMSTTLHLMAEPFGITAFSNTQDSTVTPEHIARGMENFALLMTVARKLHDQGVKIRLGTDCANGGKAVVSEQLLMTRYGFSAAEVLQISTINGAEAMGLGTATGSLEKGKQANILIWAQSPLTDPANFNAHKTVIKDGVVVFK